MTDARRSIMLPVGRFIIGLADSESGIDGGRLVSREHQLSAVA
jgi:hypothetical protein